MDAVSDLISVPPLRVAGEDQAYLAVRRVKVYSHACKIVCPEDAAYVEHQLALAHRHRNLLTEILLKGRKRFREIVRENAGLDIDALGEKADEMTSQIEAVGQELSNWKKGSQTAKARADLASRLRNLRAERKPIFEQIKSVRKAAKENPVILRLLEQADGEVETAIKKARNHYSQQLGLYWPNYLETEKAARQARFH